MLDLPKKINPDPIAEAICEIRFRSLESDEVPEVVLGKLTQNPGWKNFRIVRLPISDIPSAIRRQDPNLRHQASLELRAPDSSRVVKVGANMASLHRLAPYPGWHQFKEEIVDFIAFTFTTLQAFVCTRIGFRYVNTMSEAKHGVAGVKDFDLSVLISGADLKDPINLNYIIATDKNAEALVRVASPSFVNAPNVTELSALVDIDVYTKGEITFNQIEDAINWIEDAHTELKFQFFRLFTTKMLERLGGEKNA